MSQHSHSCESALAQCGMQKGRAKPPKATSKPYSRHILGIDSGVQSHPKATSKPHQSHLKASPKPTNHPVSKPGERGNQLFPLGLGNDENLRLTVHARAATYSGCRLDRPYLRPPALHPDRADQPDDPERGGTAGAEG